MYKPKKAVKAEKAALSIRRKRSSRSKIVVNTKVGR